MGPGVLGEYAGEAGAYSGVAGAYSGESERLYVGVDGEYWGLGGH